MRVRKEASIIWVTNRKETKREAALFCSSTCPVHVQEGNMHVRNQKEDCCFWGFAGGAWCRALKDWIKGGVDIAHCMAICLLLVCLF
jgi:hypothetical protein